jgi:hypothetical protein
MSQPKILCKHCGEIITVAGFDFPDRASFEDSDLLDVRSFCPWCEKENIWNKDDVINTLEFPKRHLVVR